MTLKVKASDVNDMLKEALIVSEFNGDQIYGADIYHENGMCVTVEVHEMWNAWVNTKLSASEWATQKSLDVPVIVLAYTQYNEWPRISKPRLHSVIVLYKGKKLEIRSDHKHAYTHGRVKGRERYGVEYVSPHGTFIAAAAKRETGIHKVGYRKYASSQVARELNRWMSE